MAATNPTIHDRVHAGQAAILDCPARFRIVACGRRYGKTTTCAKETRDDLLSNGPAWLTWWVAPTYQQAKIGFRTLLEELPEEYVSEIHRSELRVVAATGARCEFKSADQPDNLRGEGVDKLIVDEGPEVSEYAYQNALRPTLTDSVHSRMIAIGTPKGRGWFFRLWQRGNSPDWPDYESFRAPTTDNPFINRDDVEEARRSLPDRVFRQEYLAEFIDETGGVFERLDETLFTDDYPLPVAPEDAEGPFATGADLARHQDYRVVLTLDATGRLVYFDRAQHEAWPQIQAAIERVADRYPGAVAVDASRDNKIVADLEASGHNIVPVKFSPQRKRTLIEDLITRVENGELTAPDVPVLRQELEIFEYDVTRAGNVRYNAPEGFHDDTVDALALAASVLGRGTVPTATARVGYAADDTPERREFRESELGQAVSHFEERWR